MEKRLTIKKKIMIAKGVTESLDKYLSEIGYKERVKLKDAIKHNFIITKIKGKIEHDYKTIYFDMWLHLLDLLKPLYSFSDKNGFPIAQWLFEVYDYNIDNKEFLKRFINEYDLIDKIHFKHKK